MTFDEIVSEVADRLNLTSPVAITRLGRAVNVHYRRLTSSLGLQVARRITGVTANMSLGLQLVTFTGIEKIERILDDTTGSTTELTEVTLEEIRSVNPTTAAPKLWAVETMGAGSVTVRFDCAAQDTRQLKADGLQTASTLSGSQTPAFNQDFHDILVEGPIADELRKQEKESLAKEAQAMADRRTSELRFFIAKNGAQIRQHGAATNAGTVSSGGGAAPSGGVSYTQTGLVTYDRDPSAPFAVVSGSAVVPNLDADKVDGKHYADIMADALAAATIDAGLILATQVFS